MTQFTHFGRALFTPNTTLPSEVRLAATRRMTVREQALNGIADKLDDAGVRSPLVWHQDDEGDYAGFETVTPDGLRISVQTFRAEVGES